MPEVGSECSALHLSYVSRAVPRLKALREFLPEITGHNAVDEEVHAGVEAKEQLETMIHNDHPKLVQDAVHYI